MKKKLVVLNWKDVVESQKQAFRIFSLIQKYFLGTKQLQLVIAPNFSHLTFLKLKFPKVKIPFSAQNVSVFENGAHTGELSAKVLKDSGAAYCIIGHSERRSLGETNTDIARKAMQLLKNNVTPIICVGEQKRDPDAEYLSFLKDQIFHSLTGLLARDISKVIIAYEPLWSVGEGGSVVTSHQLYEVLVFIKKVISEIFSIKNPDIKILYGGSVNDTNIKDLSSVDLVDGFLLGRASVEPEVLNRIFKMKL